MSMEGVREYSEGMAVEFSSRDGRPTVVAFNQAGYDATEIDLWDLIAWIKANAPSLLEGE